MIGSLHVGINSCLKQNKVNESVGNVNLYSAIYSVDSEALLQRGRKTEEECAKQDLKALDLKRKPAHDRSS